MITPRSTRLVRVADLQAFREAVTALVCAGDPHDARDRLVVVPTRAAAAQLIRTIEDHRLADCGAVVLPDLITSAELVGALAARLDPTIRSLNDAEREVLLAVACRAACAAGVEPPFQLRPGLVAEALRFYDTLRRHQKNVAAFERLALGMFEAGAVYDRGAERLVRQTLFLVAAFREFETRSAAAGIDEHGLRRRLIAETPRRPYREAVLTVADRAFDADGLSAADWDLLARVPGLEQLSLVVTDETLAGGLHERLHTVLPGIEEVRFASTSPSRAPLLVIAPASTASASAPALQVVRDREEEVALFARRVKQTRRADAASLDGCALVVHQPLRYEYVTREVFRSAGIPYRTFDALPLASEPYAAATDLVLSCVCGNFARGPALALLRSPHFRFGRRSQSAGIATTPLLDEEAVDWLDDTDALDRGLSEAGYLGDADALGRILEAWEASAPIKGRTAGVLRAGSILRQLTGELAPLLTPRPIAEHATLLLDFLLRHEVRPEGDDPLRPRLLRARAAVLEALRTLRDAHARFDDAPADIGQVAALIRRWIDGQTFAPRAGEGGVHVVDAGSARFGSFEFVQLAGLVEGEWPGPGRGSVFYSPALLRDLGWPADAERQAGARAAFRDLLRLPASRLVVSTFSLEADALVSPSALVDELDRSQLALVEEPARPTRIFEHEALMQAPLVGDGLSPAVRQWAERRLAASPREEPRFRGFTGGHMPRRHSVSALERYQDCPFKFFAADVLGLQEAAEDESTLSPRARGRFVHEVFHRFFEAWDARGHGTIAPRHVDEARALFEEVAGPLLVRLPSGDAALERTRLFGSAISIGIVDVVLGLEASRPVHVERRLLEHRLDGEFTLGSADGRRVPVTGVADRVDLLEGFRLRVLDYKSGSAPNTRRALQVPVYALAVQEQLADEDRAPWAIDEASYVAFSGKRPLAAVVRAGGSGGDEALVAARERVFDLVAGIGRGEFPPRPYDPVICRWCAFPSVCRKEYAGGG